MKKLIAMLALATLVACGDNSTNPNTDSISGTYTLQTINGSQIPYTVSNGSTSTTLTSDVLTVADNGSWSEIITYRQTVNGTTSNGTESDSGTWSRSGTSVNFYSNVYQSTSYAGSYSNNTLSMSDGSLNYVWTR